MQIRIVILNTFVESETNKQIHSQRLIYSIFMSTDAVISDIKLLISTEMGYDVGRTSIYVKNVK